MIEYISRGESDTVLSPIK